MSSTQLDLTVVIPAFREAQNLRYLLPDLRASLDKLNIAWEVMVIDGESGDGTVDVAAENEMGCIEESISGYGAALQRGFREANGAYILTMDADLSHPTEFIESMWQTREGASLTIASRYVPGGGADQNFFRALLSKILNLFFRVGFELPYGDLSSGFRLYKSEAVQSLSLTYTNFVVLIEILLQFRHSGRVIAEVPFYYEPRLSGASKARIIQFGKDYLRLFFHMQKLRRMK